MKLSLIKYNSINAIQSEDWDRLNDEKNPFLQHRFLAALENSGTVSSKTGWTVAHLGWLDDKGQLQAVIPQYYKTHSYGEYMFDWDWAHAITKAGMAYYPKAVASIPFTPVIGSRLMMSEQCKAENIHRFDLVKQCLSSIKVQRFSNLQCLFLGVEESQDWQKAGAMIRKGYQFSWYNDNYQRFDDFLAKLRSSAKKKVRRERRAVVELGISFQCFENSEITDQIWHFFIQCYQQTYLKRSGHLGYLNHEFFHKLREIMSEQLLVVHASRGDEALAAALFIKGNNILYGRYWGTMQAIDGLHFECCYYQGIEYCINNGYHCLQPGTQGDYKRRRGFIPEHTYGAYYFTIPGLEQPIKGFLDQEADYLEKQFSEWQKTSPYK